VEDAKKLMLMFRLFSMFKWHQMKLVTAYSAEDINDLIDNLMLQLRSLVKSHSRLGHAIYELVHAVINPLFIPAFIYRDQIHELKTLAEIDEEAVEELMVLALILKHKKMQSRALK
jgi:uncharacterized membrane protein